MKSELFRSLCSFPPDDERHGTVNGYANLDCRCDRCRAAWRDHHREYMHRTARAIPRKDYVALRRQNMVHGTEAGYKRGCRCSACRHTASMARWERRQVGQVLTHNRAGYANGCRCDVCREAHRVYSAERRAKKRAAA